MLNDIKSSSKKIQFTLCSSVKNLARQRAIVIFLNLEHTHTHTPMSNLCDIKYRFYQEANFGLKICIGAKENGLQL
jgi:hypothetical protein